MPGQFGLDLVGLLIFGDIDNRSRETEGAVKPKARLQIEHAPHRSPGLFGARDLFDIPVIGKAEASPHAPIAPRAAARSPAHDPDGAGDTARLR
jgi:hypothetical protein